MLNYIDYLSPNETELSRIIGDSVGDKVDIENIRSTLLTKHQNLKILLKLGSRGCAVLTKDTYVDSSVVTHHNSQILEDFKVADTTGAGDCFTAAFFVHFLAVFNGENKDEKKNYERCMNYANACAFLCITKKGAMPSNPTAAAVKEFVAKYLPDLAI